MSLPSSKPGQQKSIRSFFQPPKTPQYAPPPAAAVKKLADASAAPPPPPAPPTTTSQPSSIPIPPPLTHKTNPALPREAIIRAVELSDINPLRRLNSLLLPVAFPDSFYAAVLDPAASHPWSRVITWSGDGNGLPQEPKIVGAVVCIPELDVYGGRSSEGTAHPSATLTNLYIRSLGVLAPYRSLGLANAALDDIITGARAAYPAVDLRTVTAHVWTENDQGMQWYRRRGFESVGAPIEGYYRKLRPDSAQLVSRPVRAGVLSTLQQQNGSSTPPPAQKQVAPSATAAIVNRSTTTLANLNSDARPPPPRGGSYQDQRSEMEWNDLPSDMMALPPSRRDLAPGGAGSEPGSGAVSGASSRSSSSAAQRKKRDRLYPNAAFGNQ